MKKQQRLFDVDEYSKKAKLALEKLEKTQQPGVQTGKVGKADILKTVKDEITSLLKKGYTAKQIADAFKDDVFGILPKTITEIAGEKPKKKNAPSARKTHPRPAPPLSSSEEQKNEIAHKTNKQPATTIKDVD
jgi:hypothetical protein